MAENSHSLSPQLKQLSDHKWTRKVRSVASLRKARALQPRSIPLDERTLRDYAAAMRRGDTFPPIMVARIGGLPHVVDGFHRLAAAEAIGIKSLGVLEAPMSERDAIFVALHANTKHGLKLTNADKQRALRLYCDEGLHLRPDGTPKSLRLIAQELRGIVSHTTVRTFLAERHIEPGDAWEDGLHYKPWSSPAPLITETIMDDAQAHLGNLRTLCDSAPSAFQLKEIHKELLALVDHVERDLEGREHDPHQGPSLDI